MSPISSDQNGHSKEYSEVNQDEHLVFFRTSAWLDEQEEIIHIPIHGWIYKQQDSQVRKSAFLKILKSTYDLAPTKKDEKNISERVNLLIADNKRGRRIIIKLGDSVYSLPKSSPNGHFETVLQVPVSKLDLKETLIRFQAVVNVEDSRVFRGESLVISPEGKSVISDIDDTVKISQVTERRSLLANTFFNDFDAVTSMPELYHKLHAQDYAFHFVSSSPWHLYEPLQSFFDSFCFPKATLNLKKIRFKDKTLLDLFKKGTETKPIVIEKILQAYPKRSFILIGDSGEEDAEVYAEVASKYPEQIERILIRRVDSAITKVDKYERIFADISKDKWQIFSLPEEIKL